MFYQIVHRLANRSITTRLLPPNFQTYQTTISSLLDCTSFKHHFTHGKFLSKRLLGRRITWQHQQLKVKIIVDCQMNIKVRFVHIMLPLFVIFGGLYQLRLYFIIIIIIKEFPERIIGRFKSILAMRLNSICR